MTHISASIVVRTDDEIRSTASEPNNFAGVGATVFIGTYNALSITAHDPGSLRRLAEALIDAEDQADRLRATTPTTAGAA